MMGDFKVIQLKWYDRYLLQCLLVTVITIKIGNSSYYSCVVRILAIDLVLGLIILNHYFIIALYVMLVQFSSVFWKQWSATEEISISSTIIGHFFLVCTVVLDRKLKRGLDFWKTPFRMHKCTLHMVFIWYYGNKTQLKISNHSNKMWLSSFF